MKKNIFLAFLIILTSTVRMFSQLPVSPTLATANVPEAAQYGVLYQLDINTSGAFSNLASVGYAVNNAAQSLNYTRVAYFLQLDNKWVWVSMNRFNATNAELGIPYNGSNIAWQQTVTAMNVYGSAGAGVTSTLNSSGNIEMWHDCYGTGNFLSGIGGNGGNYDFNDSRGGANCYGSFQVHNWAAQQTIFGFNNFIGGGTYDLGIGNNTGSHPDWTFQNNANTYTTRKLWILVNNGVFIATPPSVANVNACLNGTVAALTVSAGINSGTITSYQWYSNTVNSTTGGTLMTTFSTSATSSSYTPVTTSLGTRYYYCVVNGSNSSTAKSNVSGAINIVSPVVSLTGTATVCAGSNVTLTAASQGAGTYTWSTGANGVNIVVSPTTTSSYTVAFTNSIGCVGVSTLATVNVNPLPVLSITGSSAICAGQSGTLTAGGATSYTWNTSSNAASIVVSPGANTTYSLIGAASGCTASANRLLNVNPNPVITVNSGAICAGASFTLNPNGASTYTVQGGSLVVSPTSNASYTVAGTSTAGCVSQLAASSNVTVNANPVITVNSGSICAGQAFVITPSGALTYTVQGGNTSVSPTSNSNYTVIGTSAAGCVSPLSATSSVVVNANPTITVNSGSICAGQTFAINPNGASTYTVQGGNTTVSPAANANYTVMGTSSAGCVSQLAATSNVTVNANPVITVNSGAICAGQSFSIIPAGASTYTIQGGNANVSPTSNASYTVAGTSTAGCVSQLAASSNVTVNPNPVITVNSGSICAGQAFVITPNGALTYTVQGGNTTVSPTSNSNYTVIGTSAAGCLSPLSATSSVVVNANPTITVNSGSICVGQTFTIIPSGASTYTFQGGSAAVSPAVNTTYSVSGTSTAGCVSQNAANSAVTVNTLAVLNITGTNTLCSGGSVSLTATGASSYTWNTTATTSTLAVSPTNNTTYAVTGISPAGCAGNTATFAVTVYTLPVVSITGTNALCAGSGINLTAAGATTYTWNTGSNATTLSVTPVSTTTYSLSGRSAFGCSGNTATFAVTVNPNPALTISGASGICTGQSASLTASGAATYSWNTGSTSTSIVATPAVNTSYTVTGVSLLGCSTTTTQLVTVQASLSISVAGPTAVCNGQAANLSGLGGVTYTWNTGATTATIAPTITTTTTFSVLGASGTCSNTAIFTVAVNQNPTVTITGSTSICVGRSASLTASGATNYSWTSGSTAASVAVSPTTTASYSVTGTFSTGCSDTKTATVTVFSLPVISLSGNNVICAGDTTLLSVTGAVTYTWSTNATTNTLAVNPSTTSTYSVAGTNTNGCIAASNSTVTVNSRPVIAVSGTAAICAGNTSTITAVGASTYSWSNGSTGSVVVVTPTLSAGNYSYSVVGTSSAGCAKLYTDSIVVNAIPSLTVTGGNYVCNGNVLNLAVSGAATYSWSNGSTSSSVAVTPTVNTSYSVTGTSTAGCEATAVNDVTLVAFPTVVISGDSVVCFGDSLTLIASGANTYTWNTGFTGSLVVVQPSTTTVYNVVGAIGIGCSDTTQTSITVDALPTLSLSLNSSTICLGEETTITVNGASTYTWNTSATSNSITVSPTVTAMYSVIGTGSNSCVSRDSVSLVVSECLSLNKQSIGMLTRIYPNPNNGLFVMEMPATDAAEIHVVNVFGQEILKVKAETKNRMDLSTFDKGLYFIYVLQNNEVVYRSSVIKD